MELKPLNANEAWRRIIKTLSADYKADEMLRFLAQDYPIDEDHISHAAMIAMAINLLLPELKAKVFGRIKELEKIPG